MKLAFAILIAFSLSACYPTYNWRAVNNETFSWQALFPTKPKIVERSLSVSIESKKENILINRYSSVVENTSFVIETASFLSKNQNLKLLQKVIDENLITNFNLKPLGNEISNGYKKYRGWILSGDGSSKRQITIYCKYIFRESALIRVVVIGRSNKFSNEQAVFFINSIN